MNLQVVSPYRKCPFACPMCIASTDYEYPYANLYATNKEEYQKKLLQALSVTDGDVVITGDTEPTLFMDWLEETALGINLFGGKTIELQTKNYSVDISRLGRIHTLAYSITNVKEYFKIRNLKKIDGNNRLVILLTKDFDFLNAENFETFGFNQITFKCLQESDNAETNEYIRANKIKSMDKVYQIMNDLSLHGISVRLDENCMDSAGRYKIFRTDGKMYDKWF